MSRRPSLKASHFQANTKTSDGHEIFCFASDLFNKAIVRVAGEQEKAQAAIYVYATFLKPTKAEKLSTGPRIQFVTRWVPFFKAGG